MRALALLACGAVLALALAAGLGGRAPFGRLALALGQPALAERLFVDRDWSGLAAYRQGAYSRAAASFLHPYNRGVARARAGHYAAALEEFDRALARNPDDMAARANFELIAEIYAGTGILPDAPMATLLPKEGVVLAAPTGLGNVRAAGSGDDVTNTGTSLGLADLLSTGVRTEVRKVFDDRYTVANSRWLATLPDVPGEYLAARIAEERKRRAALGLALPPLEESR